MQFWTVTIGIAVSFCFIKPVNPKFIVLKAGEDTKLAPETISSTGVAATRWVLKTCNGCKLAITCAVKNTTCAMDQLIIHTGKRTETYCGPNQERYVMTTSFRNEASVAIKTFGSRVGSFCKVSATKPYLNLAYEKEDSSEHGQGPGNKSTTCACGWTNKENGRIVGGREAFENEYPFSVLLVLKKTGTPFCGGSIISDFHILTAAHCTSSVNGSRIAVLVGEHDYTSSDHTRNSRLIDVEKVIDHPQYDDGTTTNDISILRLAQEIPQSEKVGPVCLPTQRKKLLNKYVKVMGWGKVTANGRTSTVLNKVNLKVIDLEICRTVYGNVNTVNPSQICTWAPKRNSCQANSGGPLVWLDPETNRYTQVGIVSYGKECASTDPAVNTDIAYHLEFIKKIIRGTKPTAVCTKVYKRYRQEGVEDL
ncbi:serine-type endopeptidase activity [Nesidiocoris tenuis]|uniref:Serine-type endopeptidase activity n=1 Tax=Nesidiocoris tenuis TaxID=355587 RepID=A0ABN7B9S5_9HEMI|nr:serine-type endopeptidase activity [Nesidiocoris tenuis]